MSNHGLNIAAVAARTGVAADTLRKWEHRYGILRPTRSPGGQRRYDERDVARVEWLKARLDEGLRIGEAAALLGGGPEPSARNAAELREAMIAAASEPDPAALERLLDQAFALGTTEATLRDVVQPVLVQVGDLWESGEFNVAQEHLVSSAIRARLERLLADARGGVRGIAVLACAPGEQHELGLMMLGVLLRSDGWQVAYLGANTPVGDATKLARDLGADLFCVSASMTDHVDTLETGLRHAELPRTTRLVAGGAAVSDDVAARLGAVHPDGDLLKAVKALRRTRS